MSKVDQEVWVTISIDTECDHDINWIRANPLTFESIYTGLPDRLQPVFDDVGAVPTYLLTVEVLEDEKSVETLKNLQGSYEYGTHLHAAFVEPEKKYYDYAGVDSPEFQSGYAPEVEFAKLENLSNLFEEKLGYRPTSFRAGRYGACANTIDSLQKLGYEVDTSVTPYMRWESINGVADYRKAPRQSYFPAENTISVPGPVSDTRLVQIPVSMKPRLLRRTPRWFRPWFADVEQMKDIARFQIAKHPDHQVIVLNMMFHSMEIIENATPYPRTPEDVKKFLDDMHAVLLWCKQQGYQFGGLTAAARRFREKTLAAQ